MSLFRTHGADIFHHLISTYMSLRWSDCIVGAVIFTIISLGAIRYVNTSKFTNLLHLWSGCYFSFFISHYYAPMERFINILLPWFYSCSIGAKHW